MFPGVFDECLNTKSNDGSIHGKYCRILIRKLVTGGGGGGDGGGGGGAGVGGGRGGGGAGRGLHMWKPVLQQRVGMMPIIINSGTGNGTELIYGTCMPDACTARQLEESLLQEYAANDYKIESVTCQPDEIWSTFTAGDIVYTTLVSVLVLLVLVAGIIDMYIEKTNNTSLAQGGVRFLLPFSLYTNTRKLFDFCDEKPGVISCVHGIKVLSMTWVVYGHQQSIPYPFFFNTNGIWKKINGFLYQVIAGSYPSVDTFFLVGGLLLSYTVFKQLNNAVKFNIILFYLHRLIRLIPSIGMVAGMYATVAHFFVAGPSAENWHYWQKGCQKIWWRDVFFLDNFLPDPISPDAAGNCMDQCWYLAVDSQLYLVSPLILLPLYYYSTVGSVWFYLLSLASVFIPAGIIYHNDLPPASVLDDPKSDEYINLVYLMPWCRAGPWLVGIWLGYLIYNQGSKKATLEKWQVVAGWTAAVITGFLVVFGIWSYNTVPPMVEYDVVTQVVYGGLHRYAWACAVAWVIYASHNGYGGLVNEFLSHPVWQPLSRLTFTLYLVALTLQNLISYNSKIPYYFTHLNKVIETVGALVISGLLASVVYLTVEAPIIGLERCLLTPPDRTRKTPEDESTLSGQDNLAFKTETEDSVGVNTDLGSPDEV
ncbi:hypothetical protein OTU49_014264 [Cherax quadricarinatus]|uniref:Nose resistant to fluoxetine protein 6 n=3 Tax=Cherax quadricarinatus TaxID=27406 RepID=A0AAW0Y403_CHEQU